MCSKAVSTKNKGALENAASPPLSSGSEKCKINKKVPQQHHQHQHHHLHWFLLRKPSQRLWGWPSLCSASSGWDVRNNIDMEKKSIRRSSEFFLTWYHDTSKISFKWREMGDFSGVLLTFVLLRTIKDGHTTNWQILAKSHYFLSMASQHSQLQTCTMGALVLLRWWVSQTRGIIASAKQMLYPQSLKEYLALKGWIVWKTTSF